jgi:hypothetical protein
MTGYRFCTIVRGEEEKESDMPKVNGANEKKIAL